MRTSGIKRRHLGMAATAALALVAANVAVAGSNGPADAGGTKSFEAALSAVPHDPAADGGSNASGAAELTLMGNTLTAQLTVSGATAGLPHAMHIHGDRKAANECPGPARRDDITDDGLIETAEGLPDYGPIDISFTTSGDTSAASGLALNRFPVADASGTVTYMRTFNIPGKFASKLGDLHIVVHGHDINGNGTYDGPSGALGVPIEAELPIVCGTIN